jgi:hypothetical protein
MTATNLPDQGVVFWPVGSGDSTTIVIDQGLVMQVDLRDMASADDDGAVVAPVIDRLRETLPTADGNPYLAAFVLTHADLDHCCGFGDLLDSDVVIGELWATPRLWRELDDEIDLCDDAQRFHDEAKRRIAATVKAVAGGRQPVSGDRVRVIGYDDDRERQDYSELPDECFTFPGQLITSVDGQDVSSRFEAFVHAPFRDDCAAARNETSLALQVTLTADDGAIGRILLFGDLSHDTLKKIFDYSELHGRPERLEWDVLLAPHHCSKGAMYVAADGEQLLDQELLDQFERHARPGAWVVASAYPFRPADSDGDNPPHCVARDRYEEIVDNAVLCTGEYPSEGEPHPVVFGLQPGAGLELLEVEKLEEELDLTEVSKSSRGGGDLLVALGGVALAAGAAWAAQRSQRRGTPAVREAVEQSRGLEAAPATTVGFGGA